MGTETTTLSREIERAIAALDVGAIERAYWDQDEFVFIPRFLDPEAIAPFVEDMERLTPQLNRNYIPRHKKGGASVTSRSPRPVRRYSSSIAPRPSSTS